MRPRRSYSFVWLGLLLALFSLPVCWSCKSKKRENLPDTPRTTVDPAERRSIALGLRSLNPERKITEFQKPPELPKSEPVALLDAGTGKKRALRYAIEPGGREFTVRANVTTREFVQGTWLEPVTLPEIRLGLGITRVAERDDLQIRGLPAVLADSPANAGASGTDPAKVLEVAKQFLARHTAYLERRRGHVSMDERGRLGRITLAPDAENSAEAPYVRAQMAQMLLESIVPLPEEPIGANARWRAVTLLYRGQAVVKQTADYQLLSMDEKKAKLAVTVTQIGEHQAVAGPDMPASHRAELVALYWRARGELDLDLTSPVPTAGTMDVELRVHGRTVEMTGQGVSGREHDYFLDSQGTLQLGAVLSASEPAGSPGPAGDPGKVETQPGKTPG